MGATLFYHPSSWESIIPDIKATAGGNTKVGVNVNWEKICGCPSTLIYSTQYYNVSRFVTSSHLAANSSRSRQFAVTAMICRGPGCQFVHVAIP